MVAETVSATVSACIHRVLGLYATHRVVRHWRNDQRRLQRLRHPGLMYTETLV